MHLLVLLTACALLAQGDSGFSYPRLSDAKSIRMLTPEVADFIKTADTVSIFRLDLSKKAGEPGYEVHFEPVAGREREELVSIFSEPANYYQGLYCIGEPPSDFGI